MCGKSHSLWYNWERSSPLLLLSSILYFVRAGEELRREAAEISRLLSSPKTPIPLSVWLWTLFGCSLVVLCGILPAFLLPANTNEYLRTEGRHNLSLLLSFAVGSLLGDVFLHLLPEAWVDIEHIGLCTMGGLLICSLVEKLCSTTEESQHKVCAIMNLVANLVDNFTHGLAVGASFLVSPKFGMMTTFAILVHEIPHEISDFAILLRADFDRLQAVKAQLVTAFGGVVGACAALWLQSSAVQSIDWILPFTAGGFINISLAQILPELNQETSRRCFIELYPSVKFLVKAQFQAEHQTTGDDFTRTLSLADV
ncbi:unnamed protein product [Angiostrongylus costaricensis]|uniref:Uncharacterized protein n=1 Tax=Angiostrongylus costaricensis TaxID=334426 RepID=A0A3P7JS85_ANGCS|nr:unnamed protein product [Angiostrongylus costaricensis]